jgi:hypothetical protein
LAQEAIAGILSLYLSTTKIRGSATKTFSFIRMVCTCQHGKRLSLTTQTLNEGGQIHCPTPLTQALKGGVTGKNGMAAAFANLPPV